jgi:hypothetical protein
MKFVTERGTVRTGENFQAAFPHCAARARSAGTAEDGVAEAMKSSAVAELRVKIAQPFMAG